MKRVKIEDVRVGERYWWNDPRDDRNSGFVKAKAKVGNFIICRTEYGESVSALACELEDLQEKAESAAK